VTMDESAEGQTILEAEMEILDIDLGLVGGGLSLAPEQETLFGRQLFHGNVLDGESQNDGPDHSQSHLAVSVDDFFSSDGDELDSLGRDEVERFVDVGDLVESHFATIGLGQLLAGNDFEQQHEFEAVAEIMLDVFDLRPGLTKMAVAPGREGLSLLFLPGGVEESLPLPLLLLDVLLVVDHCFCFVYNMKKDALKIVALNLARKRFVSQVNPNVSRFFFRFRLELLFLS